MAFSSEFVEIEPAREDIDALRGSTLLEFGTDWCGHCQKAESIIRRAFDAHPQIAHIKVEDGRGRRLGRSFGVKLWPSLIFLTDGCEVARLTRPESVQVIEQAMQKIDCR